MNTEIHLQHQTVTIAVDENFTNYRF